MDTAALIVTVLGSVCLFLFGMKWMGSALQRLSGGPLRRALRSMTLSPGRSVLSGTLITAVVQSSSVVTVMIVSFVHARLLGLRQAVAMILGANVGTTVTAWLVVLLGFGFDSTSVAMALLIPAFGMSALGQKRTRDAGRMLCGLALLLLAIGIFGSNVASLTGRPAVTDWLAGLSGRGAGTALLFALAGALLTALVQSSSAMTAFTIVLCGGGLIPFECALAMVLGENVGTTATANLAAVVTSADARRAALSHFLINLFGVLWALPLLPWLALGIADLIVWAGGVSPLTSAVSQPVGLALFHTLSNAVNAMLLFPLVPRLAGLTRRMIRGKGRARQAGSGPVRVPRVPEGELSAYPLRVLLAKRVRAVYGMFWMFAVISGRPIRNGPESVSIISRSMSGKARKRVGRPTGCCPSWESPVRRWPELSVRSTSAPPLAAMCWPYSVPSGRREYGSHPVSEQRCERGWSASTGRFCMPFGGRSGWPIRCRSRWQSRRPVFRSSRPRCGRLGKRRRLRPGPRPSWRNCSPGRSAYPRLRSGFLRTWTVSASE